MKRLTNKFNRKNMIMECDLSCRFDARQNFYGKAKVVTFKNGCSYLISYSTVVACITKNTKGEYTAHVRGQYSQTTTRHQKEYLKQNGFYINNLKDMLSKYESDKVDWCLIDRI